MDDKKERGESTVSYGATPYYINITARPQTHFKTESIRIAYEEVYVSDNKTEGGTLVYQK